MRTNGAFLRTFDSPRHLQGRQKQQNTTGTSSPQPGQEAGAVHENGVKSNSKTNGKKTDSKLSPGHHNIQMYMTSSSSG